MFRGSQRYLSLQLLLHIQPSHFILLSPVWMIGLCLLYVDERVRTEGYDIELMAARRLGDIPSVPEAYINPLNPALSSTIEAAIPDRPERPSPFTMLGLK